MTKESKTTPLMRQYLDIKAKHQDEILFFRMGDFYELFYDDAKIASEVLGLTLTSRAHGKSSDVPLAGFPYHALDTYLSKMVKAGYRVAICEQVEDPKQAKTIVKRAITEIVTPGTALADELLDSRSNNYLAAVYFDKDMLGVATVDISTGEFRVIELGRDRLVDYLTLIQPAEILIADEQEQFFRDSGFPLTDVLLTRRDAWTFSYDYAYEKLTQHFKTLTLKGFGCEDMHAGISAAGACLHYLKENQQSELEHITALSRDHEDQHVGIDSSTQRNLEIMRTLRGEKKGSLIAVIDKTVTPMGARLLARWVTRPLRTIEQISLRHDAVDEIHRDSQRSTALRDGLKNVGDLERLITKVITQRANARDLLALADSLAAIAPLREQLADCESRLLQDIREKIDPITGMVAEIRQALVDNPPLSVTEGAIIRDGYHEQLDKLREIAFSGKDWILKLQTSEREKTGIPSLKVSYNRVFGYYIEVTKPNLSKVPEHYIRKQTLVNAERFITPELKEYEEQVLQAEEKIVALEYDLFLQLRNRVAGYAQQIQTNAYQIAVLDCLCNFAVLAVENKYVRPQMHDKDSIDIIEGRHPVVEKILPFGENFVPNDTHIDCKQSQIQIITGPNMAGKSTYLRQVALIALMAQIGSFVPAKSAKIGVVDKIFTRVGASDNLAAGESTFLVEMSETANILNNVTPRSLVILDEIGRGTSTFDGLSIAWAVVEYLHQNSNVAAKTLFATHYHELTELEMILPRVKNYSVAVKEWGDQIVFLRRIVEGGSDHSYGIQVAKLAGLPGPVITRAKEVLLNLEQNALTPNHTPKLAARPNQKTAASRNQLDFFASENNFLAEELKKADIENMTPLQAFSFLVDLKAKISG